MTTYTHRLSEIELACGVTLDQVARELPRVLVREGGATVVVDATLPPALAGSVARAAFGHHSFKFSHFVKGLDLAVYTLAEIGE